MRILCLLMLGILALVHLTLSTKITNIKGETIEISDSEFFGLSTSARRHGFEAFYQLSNMFIDAAFVPKLTLKNITDLISNSNSLDINSLIKLPQDLYPSLFYFTITVIVLAFVLPLIGLVYCSYRCCCMSKFNPYDRKYDGCKRKFYGLVLLFLLMLLLIGSIVLFFTNQNSLHSMKEVPVILKNVRTDLDSFTKNEIPVFYQSVTENFKIDQNDSDQLLKTVSETFLKKFSTTFNTSELVTDLRKDSDTIINLVTSSNSTVVPPELVKEIQKNFDFDSQINQIFKEINDELNSIKIDLSKFSDSSSMIVDKAKEFIESTNTSELFTEIEDDVTKAVNNYYSYFYYTLIIVSVFFLFLFLLYATGLAGICARRTNLARKQCCHRTTLARMMLAGIGFFFIFSWLFLIFSVTMSVPGVFVRHLVCKPLIEIENNQLFQSLIPDPQYKSINFTKVLRECDRFNQSKELNSFVTELLKNNIDSEESLVKLSDSALESINLKTQLNNFIKQSIDNLKNFKKDIDEKSQGSSTLALLLQQLVSEITEIISKLENYLVSENNSTDAEKNSYQKLLSNLNEVKKETAKEVANRVVVLLNTKTDSVMNDVSCQVLSTVYKRVTKLVCFDYIDNFNAFWFYLVLIVLINILVAFFAAKQSNLFRKNYGYDDMISDEISVDEEISKNGGYYTKNKPKSQSKESMIKLRAIDAYEMKQTHHRNNQQRLNHSSTSSDSFGTPPPQYHRNHL